VTITDANLSGGVELMHKTVGWLNKYHNQFLLVSVCLTLLSIRWFISPEIKKLDFVLAVFFTVVIFIIITRLSGFDSWDRLASSKTVKPSLRRSIAVYILITLVTAVFSYLWTIYGWEGIPGYFFGFLLVSWGWYLQILYWERKNRKIIVVSGYFKPTGSAINPGDNE
jgi:hypothetical protein